MDAQRAAYATFLSMHAQKAKTTSVPTAHVMFYNTETNTMPLNTLLIAMTYDNVMELVSEKTLEKDSLLVQWFLQQLVTYKCETQRLVALVFDSKTVLSDVLRCT